MRERIKSRIMDKQRSTGQKREMRKYITGKMWPKQKEENSSEDQNQLTLISALAKWQRKGRFITPLHYLHFSLHQHLTAPSPSPSSIRSYRPLALELVGKDSFIPTLLPSSVPPHSSSQRQRITHIKPIAPQTQTQSCTKERTATPT